MLSPGPRQPRFGAPRPHGPAGVEPCCLPPTPLPRGIPRSRTPMLGVLEGVVLSPTHPELASRCPGLSSTWALPDGKGRVPACAGAWGWHRAVCREQCAGNAVTVTITAGPDTPTLGSHPSSSPLFHCPRGRQVPRRYLGDGGFIGQALEDRGVVVAVLHNDRQLPGGLAGAGEGEGHGVQLELWSRPSSPPGGDVAPSWPPARHSPRR